MYCLSVCYELGFPIKSYAVSLKLFISTIRLVSSLFVSFFCVGWEKPCFSDLLFDPWLQIRNKFNSLIFLCIVGCDSRHLSALLMLDKKNCLYNTRRRKDILSDRFPSKLNEICFCVIVQTKWNLIFYSPLQNLEDSLVENLKYAA